MENTRHFPLNMSMFLLSITVFCIIFCAQSCKGTTKYGGLGIRKLVEKDSYNSTSSESPISAPHKDGASSSAPTDSFSKGNSNKAKPIASPASSSVSAITGQSWCVAMSNVPQQKLQAALDYACGIGGADCGPIQQGAGCFQPDSLVSHASYAFNSYYQKMGMVQGTCDFGGTAVTTPTDPSYGTCQYTTSGGLSLVNSTTGGTAGTSVGFVPPYMPSMAHSILINLEFLITLASLLVAVLMLSHL